MARSQTGEPIWAADGGGTDGMLSTGRPPFRVAVFASGGGSNFQAIIDRVNMGELDIKLELLVSDKPESKAVERAQAAGIDTFTFRPKDYASREAYEREIVAEMDRRGIDLVVMAGFMRLVTEELVRPYYGRMINIHPALLPAFKGAHGIADALKFGVKVTGVTVHYVSLDMDAGPIIGQQAVEVSEGDTEEMLAARIHAVEHNLLPQAIRLIREGRVRIEGNRTMIQSEDSIRRFNLIDRFNPINSVIRAASAQNDIKEEHILAIKRALISVSDKSGIVEFAAELAKLGVELISTGGTKSLLESKGVPVIGISDVTGFPEILDGRVKTLHPAVHSGLLAIRDSEEHQEQMEKLGLDYIDMVIVNLYPFQQTIEKQGVTYEDAIENIDIGGPTMLRSAAKNHAFVSVLVDASDYPQVLEEIRSTGDTTLDTRKRLAAKVFRHTGAYDALISDYLSKQTGEILPERMTVTYEKVQELRYGENPHQRAAFYRKPLAPSGNITTAEQLHGKELSYNNINDANAALQIVKEFTDPAVVAVKHMNPCGVGIGKDIHEAYKKAYEADSTSIFGGIVAANRTIGEETALLLNEIFLEIVIAPDFTEQALDILKKKKNIRLMTTGDLAASAEAGAAQAATGQHGYSALASANFLITSVEGGMLVQDSDRLQLSTADLKVVTDRAPTDEELKQLLFGWKVVKHVKSNAIVLANNDMTVGVGAGQMNRVGAARIAIEQAGPRAKGSVLASDAYFPMGDTLEVAAKAGITAVIQPGGSIKDEESIKVANDYGIAMVFTGARHFKH